MAPGGGNEGAFSQSAARPGRPFFAASAGAAVASVRAARSRLTSSRVRRPCASVRVDDAPFAAVEYGRAPAGHSIPRACL